MSEESQRYDLDRVIRLLLSVGTIVGVIWLLGFLSEVLVPFAVALLLAYLLNPIVDAFERLTGRRGAAVALTLAIFAMFIVVTVPLVGQRVYHEISDVSQMFADREIKTKIVEKLNPVIELFKDDELRAKLDDFIENSDPDQVKQLAVSLLQPLAKQVWNLGERLAGFLGSLLNVLLALTGVVVILLYLVFLMMDFTSFQAEWKDALPPSYRDAIVEFLAEFSAAMSRYFRSQCLVALCVGVLFAIGFSIVGLRMAVLLGLFVGLLNMVPYLQVIGLLPALALALLKGFENATNVVWPVLWVLAVFAIVQLFQDAFLVPKIMGKSTGLKPWVILLGIFVWGKLLGFLGLVLAIPLSCLGLAYYRRFILKDHPSA